MCVFFSHTYGHIHTILLYSPPNSFPAMGKEKSSSWCHSIFWGVLVDQPLADGHKVLLLWFCALPLLWGQFLESRKYHLKEPP